MVLPRLRWYVRQVFVALSFVALDAAADTGTSVGDAGGEADGPFAGLLQAPEANLFSGALSHVISIRIPPGRKNATPDLKLVYSSLGGGGGLLGEGWSLPLGTIERSTKRGVPRCGTAGYDNTKDFVLTLNGATLELVEYTAGSNPVYRPRTDQSFLEAIRKSSNTWEVIERSGMRYFFGETTESRLSRTGTCAYTAVWGLTKVQDPNGNTINVTYRTGELSLVPSQISYGAQTSGSHPFVLDFSYIDYLPKTTPIPSYQKGVREEVDDLLDTIAVKADGQTVRTYQLQYDDEYTTSPFPNCSSSRRALLCQVSVDAFPTQTFEYAPDSFGHGTAEQEPPGGFQHLRAAGGNGDVQRSVMDMNGDGLLDLVDAPGGGQDTWIVYYGLPTGGISTVGSVWHTTGDTVAGNQMRDQGNFGNHWAFIKEETIDLTGDGLPDFIDANADPWLVYRGTLEVPGPLTGPGFEETPLSWDAPEPFLGEVGDDGDSRRGLVDMNADGRPDLVITNPASGSTWKVYTNSGSGFVEATDLAYGTPGYPMVTATFDGAVTKYSRDFLDFNGDGLPDQLDAFGGAPSGKMNVHLNNGGSFDPPFLVTLSYFPYAYQAVRVVDAVSGNTLIDHADVTGDGLPDRIYASGTSWWVYVNVGVDFLASSFEEATGLVRINNGTGNTKVDLLDWNGDGFLDVVDARGCNGNNWCIYTGGPVSGPGTRPYLLTAVHNGIGGVSHARYGPSTRYANTLLPFVSWLLTGTRRTDGLCSTSAADPYDPGQNGNACIGSGNEIVRTYKYAEGFFDGVSREFRGFGMVTESFVGPGEKGYREVSFNQAAHTRGQIDLEEVFADVGKPASRETFVWRAKTPADGPRTQVYMAEHTTETLNIDTSASVSQCMMERNTVPDVYGRVGTQCTLACGSSNPGICTGLPAGAVTVSTTWANPESDPLSGAPGVRERPAQVTTSYMSGPTTSAMLTRKNYFYDDLVVGLVGKGNVTRVETEMIGGSASENAVVVNGYDGTYGNIVSLEGPGAEKSTSAYGASTFQLYPTTERQCLTSGCTAAGEFLEATKMWSIRYGKETAITGPNAGQTQAFSYDAAGRVECEAQPNDSLSGCKDGMAAFTRTAEYTYVYGDSTQGAFDGKLSHVEVKTREPNSPTGYLVSRSYVDALGRKRFTTSQRVIGAGNTLVTVVGEQVSYDSQGRVTKEYAPYTGTATNPPASTVKFTDYSYLVGSLPDPLHRARVTRTPADQQRSKQSTVKYVGDTVTTTDQYGNETTTQSDAFGREISRKLHSGAASPGTVKLQYSYTYDGLDRALSTTVGPASVTRTYDSLGRMRVLNDPDSGLWTWDYDKSGNPLFQNDPKPAQHLEACYDKLNRVTVECSYADDVVHGNACGLCVGGTSGNGTLVAVYVYDKTSGAAPDCGGPGGKGQLSNVSDFAGTGGECFFYDIRGNVTRNEKTVDNKTAVTQFAYDPVDHLTILTYPDTIGVNHTYQADGLPNTIASVVSEVEYDVFGRITQLFRVNGTVDTYLFDTAGTNNFRLETLQAKKGTTATYLNLGYLYEDRGKLSQVTDARDGSGTSGLSNDVVYSYDGLGRLTTVNWNEGQSTYDEAFGHGESLGSNSVGNLTCKAAGGLTCGSGGTFGLGSAGPHQPTSWGPYTQMTYDGNGARLKKDRGNGTRQEYAYEARGRLSQIKLYTSSTLDKTIDFTYDYNGGRVAKAETGITKRRYFNQFADSANGNLTLYYFLGTRMVASYTKAYPSLSEVTPTLLVEPERIDLPPAAVVLFAATVLLLLFAPLGRRRLGVRVSLPRAAAISVVLLTSSAPVVLVAGCGPPPQTRAYHIDRLGTVQAVSDWNGNLVEQVRYYAYGEARGRFNASGGTYTPPITADDLRHEFTGYETDFASALEYAGARWFDPELGQFQSLDPQRQFPSPYAYGPGDPINGTDPTGEVFDWVAFVVIALVVASAAALDTYIQTGDWGAALKSFGLSIAGSVVGIGIGWVAGRAVNAIAGTIADEALQVGVVETYQAIETYGGYAAGAYGAVDSIANGRPFSAGISIGIMAYGNANGDAASGGTGDGNPYDPQVEAQEHFFWENFPQYRDAVSDASGDPLTDIFIDDWWDNGELRSIYEQEGYWSIRTTGSHDVDLRFGRVHLTYDTVGGVSRPALHMDLVDPQKNLLGHFIVDVAGNAALRAGAAAGGAVWQP